MARMMVYVPDPLYNRAQQWKDRLNVSELFQGALAAKLRVFEQADEDSFEVAANVSEEEKAEMLERFKQEKLVLESSSYRYGFNCAIGWAKQAHCSDLTFYVGYDSASFGNLPELVVSEVIREQIDSKAGIAHHSLAEGWFRAIKTFLN